MSALRSINSSFGHDLAALRLLFNKESKDVLKSLYDFLADSAGHNLAVASIQHVDLDDDENNLKFQFGYNAPEEYRQWLASLHNLAGEGWRPRKK